MNKTTWIIEPRDALIVRDGKPFGAEAGNRASSLAFPFPSTTTGAVRTRAGLATINGELSRFDRDLGNLVQREITVRGALLVEIKDANNVEILVHAPADAVLFETENKEAAKIVPLVPLETDESFVTNSPENLCLLGLQKNEKAKPHKDAPKFWRWTKFEKWLTKTEVKDNQDLQTLGTKGLTNEQRMHVEMDYHTKSGVDGGLFQTRGLEFTTKPDKDKIEFAKYGLLVEVETDGEFDGAIKNGLAPLGAERRIVAWRKTPENFAFPECKISEPINEHKACRIILLTPAYFANGFLPSEWQEKFDFKIEAVAVNRHEVVSGYDFKKGKPKPTRRLCPAGTVFFVKFNDAEKINEFMNKTWFRCVSDGEQERKDGFGLACLGTWDGEPLKVEDALKNEKNNH